VTGEATWNDAVVVFGASWLVTTNEPVAAADEVVPVVPFHVWDTDHV
jgi:hypothetical protein